MQTLFYFHDPMCSWCWGYSPTWQTLQQLLPSSINVEYRVGGLAADSDKPMQADMANAIQSHWRRIESELGTEFNYDFWTQCKPLRSTYPACRAVIAAKQQDKEQEMIRGIQEAYYLRAMNPSNINTLIQIAKEQTLDIERFEQDVHSSKTEKTLLEQVQLARQWQVPGFPSLVLSIDSALYPIDVNYKDATATMGQIKDKLKLSGLLATDS